MRVKRLTRCALLTAIALAIFVLEAQIPIPFPVPGMKLGLSNIITLFALFSFGWKDALAIVVIRILLGNLASGQVMALLYSLGGGLLSFAGMALLCRIVTAKQVWAAGAAGGLLHNLGQMAVALAVTRTPGLLVWLPVLLLCGLGTGLFTGLCAQLLLRRRLISDKGDTHDESQKNDFERAVSLLHRDGYTCVLCDRDRVLTSREHGLAPLIRLLDTNESLQDMAAADRLIGRAAALLLLAAGVKAVYGEVMSEEAHRLLSDAGVRTEYGTLVPKILNRAGTAPCPMEQAAEAVTDPAEALPVLRQALQELQKQ